MAPTPPQLPAGMLVPNASIFGYSSGTAKGGSPKARVAAYKVCWPSSSGGGCFDSEILAAFDYAVPDGVDVLSVSVGGGPTNYFQDAIAIGSFHPVRNGITVSCLAGNDGPQPYSVANTAPWILTVAASTMDREFPSYLLFGNKRIKGQSLSETSLRRAANANASSISAVAAQYRVGRSLDPVKVKGKIVVCLLGINGRDEGAGRRRESGWVSLMQPAKALLNTHEVVNTGL